jgi:hypothetical protein
MNLEYVTSAKSLVHDVHIPGGFSVFYCMPLFFHICMYYSKSLDPSHPSYIRHVQLPHAFRIGFNSMPSRIFKMNMYNDLIARLRWKKLVSRFKSA